jgi:hypothetical protein
MDSKASVTLSWYASHLAGFHKTHGYADGRSQDTFYSADGMTLVSVTGEPGKNSEDTDTYSVLYTRVQQRLSEKTIIGINQHNIVRN